MFYLTFESSDKSTHLKNELNLVKNVIASMYLYFCKLLRIFYDIQRNIEKLKQLYFQRIN